MSFFTPPYINIYFYVFIITQSEENFNKNYTLSVDIFLIMYYTMSVARREVMKY
nr:MAG TPA: hypothetical protein [Caudoviricetes sp.]DAM63621.1 MAG TPA: hypothetical protein [Caudoviricetes sp.]DAX87451.1 MAG TPA: hypothetical protein [Caudoviricetes sp.]DAY35270.1 MAG TPA: hypothetical protein [Caudoviricetes sp.]